MNKSKSKWSLSLSSVVLLVSTVGTHAFADNRAGAVTISPGAGAYIFSHKRDISVGPTLNLGLGYDFTPNWGIQALVGETSGGFKGTGSQGRASGSYYLADALYHFRAGHDFQPYLLAGAGASSISPIGSEPRTQANVNAGLGAEYFISPSIAFNASARDIVSFRNPKQDVLVTGGLTFLLGGEQPAVVQPAPMPAPAPEPLPVKKPDPCLTQATHIHFANNSAAISSKAAERLSGVTGCLKEHQNLHANINGYASELGSSKYNMDLSVRRAQAVKEYLVNHSVEPSRLQIKGFGFEHPVASNKTRVGQAENRRVTVRLTQ